MRGTVLPACGLVVAVRSGCFVLELSTAGRLLPHSFSVLSSKVSHSRQLHLFSSQMVRRAKTGLYSKLAACPSA